MFQNSDLNQNVCLIINRRIIKQREENIHVSRLYTNLIVNWSQIVHIFYNYKLGYSTQPVFLQWKLRVETSCVRHKIITN